MSLLILKGQGFRIKEEMPLRLWNIEIQREGQGGRIKAGIATARTQGGALAQVPAALKTMFPVFLTPLTKIPTNPRTGKGITLLPHIEDLLKR